MSRTKIVVFVILFISISGLMAYLISQNIRLMKRDIPTLFNHYYKWKATNPWKAKEALDLILAQDPNNNVAIHALALWYSQQGDTHSALEYLQKSHLLFPQDETVSLELAKLYIMLNQIQSAKEILKPLLSSKNQHSQRQANYLYHSIFPKDPIQIANSLLISYIEPIKMSKQFDLTPLFIKVQEIINLQPDAARSYLHLILNMDPNSQKAYMTLGYLELKGNHLDSALENFLKAFSLKPEPGLSVQIGYLLVKKNKTDEALYYFNYGLEYGSDSLKRQASQAITYLKRIDEPVITVTTTSESPNFLSLKDKLLLLFYEGKQKNLPQAWRAIHQLLQTYPADVRILKEAAYFAAEQKKTDIAIAYWKKAYLLEANPEYALNIAYLYDSLNEKAKAFRYFDLASKSSDQELAYKAQTAMTNLGGAQTKWLPAPFFAEFYAAPFYFSRFDLGVLPLINRVGVSMDPERATEIYFSNRRTKDNRSGVEDFIPQIFEDNVAIYSIGFRTSPFKKVPLLSFVEVGRAEDLIDRDRPKWRGDIRGGIVYFNVWGEKPTYTSDLQFPFKWRAVLYSDIIYYSRYDNNIIGTSWFRPGVRAATYQSASIDIYLANYLIWDKNHEFFNNTYLVGPGIVIQPTNRLNVVVRYESLQGYYIPVHSPTRNPYRSKYYNNVVLLEMYFRF